MEDKEKQFLATIGAWAHLQNQRRQTEELQKQNRAITAQTKAEEDRAKIEEKRLQLEIEWRNIDQKLKETQKIVRKQMLSLSQSISQVSGCIQSNENGMQSSDIIFDLGILSYKVKAIEDNDVLSDLTDLEYLAKLQTELEKITSDAIDSGICNAPPIQLLHEECETFNGLAIQFASLLNIVDEKVLTSDSYLDEKRFKEKVSAAWKTFEIKLDEFEQELDLKNGDFLAIPSQVMEYEAFKDENYTLLKEMSSLHLYLSNKRSFKNNKLKELHSLIEKYKPKSLALDLWEQGAIEELDEILKKNPDTVDVELSKNLNSFKEYRAELDEVRCWIDKGPFLRPHKDVDSFIYLIDKISSKSNQFPEKVKRQLEIKSITEDLSNIQKAKEWNWLIVFVVLVGLVSIVVFYLID